MRDRVLDFYDQAARKNGFYAAHVYAYFDEQMRLQYERAHEKNQREMREQEMMRRELDALCAKRTEARARRDWEAADAVRDEMRAHGVRPKDLPDGRCSWEALRG